MFLREVTVGVLGTCCYLIGAEDREDCLVIDPGDEAPRIRKAAEGRKIAAILLTHGHFDHFGGAAELMGEGARLFIHPLDEPMLRDPDLNASRGLIQRALTAPEATDRVEEGDTLNLAGLTIQILHTPGHTPGSVCYRAEDHFFTGDTLFEHGWGRTDLPGGSQQDLFRSLRRLIPLVRGKMIYPGHEG